MQRGIPATYMRGGTSKGVFFLEHHLPKDPAERDAVLLRIMGSPDPYGKQIDGLGGATSSTSKVVIVSRSERPKCDINYLFGQVAIDRDFIDWSGNCGNLSAAVAPFAISQGLAEAPRNGSAEVVIWQANIEKVIVARVPMCEGEVVELGDFELDGVSFPAAEIKLSFMAPGSSEGMLPTGNFSDHLDIHSFGSIEATLINAGNPLVFVNADEMGLTGIEHAAEVDTNRELLDRFEKIRAHAAVVMGLADSPEWASLHRPATPKIAFVGRRQSYISSGGKKVEKSDVDLLVRALSMGKLHHAMPGTGAVAIASAAALPGTVISKVLTGPRALIRFGHPSGVMSIGAQAQLCDGSWEVTQVDISRSARRLMEGRVFVP